MALAFLARRSPRLLARPLSANPPLRSLAEAPVRLYGAEPVPLREVCALTPSDGRVELAPFDPTTSGDIRASLADSLAATDYKVFYDAGARRVVVTSKHFQTDTSGASKAATKRVVRAVVDEDLLGDARDLDDLAAALPQTRGRWVVRRVARPKPNKRDAAARQLVDEAEDDYRTSRRVASGSKKALRQVAVAL